MKTNFKFGEVLNLASLAKQESEHVDFKNIFGSDNGGVSLLAFKAGQVLDRHVAPWQLMVYVVEGEIEFTMLDDPHAIKAGEFLLMGEEVPHAVAAKTDAKVLLIKIKP